MKKIVCILLSMFLYGCGTLTTLKDPCPYIGTRYDYNMVVGNFYDGVGFKHMTRPLYFIDWPLSVVADTALLPVNNSPLFIYQMMKQENLVGNMVIQIINILG